MTIDLASLPKYAGPALSLLAGIVILVNPRVLNYVVAFYLIIVGILGLLPFIAH